MKKRMGRICAKKERKGLNKKERREEGEKVTSEKKKHSGESKRKKRKDQKVKMKIKIKRKRKKNGG